MTSFKPQLSTEEIRNNFSDIAPAFSNAEATVEATRCLYCYDAPCIKACPTHINIPQFIQQIATGDVKGSAKTIFTENIFGGTCGRACPTSVLCEGACVYNDLNKKPIEIGRLQRFATDYAISEKIQYWEKGEPSGRKVAIVGAGPSGLACAHALTKLGHECVVYEASDKPGGLNTFGVAEYKVTGEFSLAEVEYVRSIGIELRLNTPVGSKPSVQDLLKTFDAVFIGMGMGSTANLSIPGEDLEGSLEALEFIRPTRDATFAGAKVGKHVVVIGAGNTAIDVATAAVRLGAKRTTIVYRRTEGEMPAFKYEYELAKHDGVVFQWLSAPTRIVGANGKVTGVECQRMERTSGEGKRGAIKPIPGSEFVIECDMVVKALGQNPLTEFLSGIQGLTLSKVGSVVVDPINGATSVKGLFAGGDCTLVGEVVDAVEHGKRAAIGINTYLKN